MQNIAFGSTFKEDFNQVQNYTKFGSTTVFTRINAVSQENLLHFDQLKSEFDSIPTVLILENLFNNAFTPN
jgi:hypothetical protein